jgi:hypothetical protein
MSDAMIGFGKIGRIPSDAVAALNAARHLSGLSGVALASISPL